MIYTVGNIPDDLLSRFPRLVRKPGLHRKRHGKDYLDAVCAFDIETTALDRDISVMYIWQFQIGFDITVIGRSWKEFKRFIRILKSQMPDGLYLVVYVHNLAFEFQFLRGVFSFGPDDVFCIAPRKPLRVFLDGFIELRCSYLHSNMRLETFLDKMGVENKKLPYDYSIKRFSWTPLSDAELQYCINDVRGLVQALSIEMLHDGDDLYTIPLTSTGYVRRDVKSALGPARFYIRNILPDWELYQMLREAFRGGNTHANRFYARQKITGVLGEDRSSSYSDVQMNNMFPVTRFRFIDESVLSVEKMRDVIGRRKKAALMRVSFTGIRLKDWFWGCPYIPIDKCRALHGEEPDNGRVLSAAYLEITLTDIDFRIIESEYEWDAMEVFNLAYARYGPLPESLKSCIRGYYKLKTELKGKPGQEILYMKSKNKLNSIYGMSAQNPAKLNILFKGNDYILDDEKTLREVFEENRKTAWFPYQWGVWTTAWARQRLEEGIRLAGDGFVYADTDSVKHLYPIDWSRYNDERRKASEENGAFARDANGIFHYMGVFEPEPGYPATFATRGAKKYVVLHSDGTLEATISGVSKRTDGGRISGGMELERAGGIDAFLRDEFTFQDAGGVELRYNDRLREMRRIDGHRIKIRECVTIVPSTYLLSDTDEYEETVLTAAELQEFMLDAMGIKPD